MKPRSPKASDSWCTPYWLTQKLPAVDLDPCSNRLSSVEAKYTLSLEDGFDGLALPWSEFGSTAFVNPPYSRVRPWVDRAAEFARAGGRTLMLVKNDPTTRWWAAAIAGGAEPVYFRKRVKFAGAKTGATFPSAFLVFGDSRYWQDTLDALRRQGWIW